jgi:hypothetical protein
VGFSKSNPEESISFRNRPNTGIRARPKSKAINNSHGSKANNQIVAAALMAIAASVRNHCGFIRPGS